MQVFDAVVVGAGPAGLSAAAELSAHGSCLLLDQGPLAGARNRNAPDDLLSGVGGAGLFSDGKHSFFPSASALWKLPDRAALATSFESTAALLRRYGVDAGALPDERTALPVTPGAWHEKNYPALYVGFAERLACIEELWTRSGERVAGARVLGAGRSGREIVLSLKDASSPRRWEVRTARLVVATGRWSPRWIRPWLTKLGASFTFRRVEFGVRLESAATHALFRRLPGVDGKLQFFEPAGGIEVRTFCTCRNGEVVLGRAGGIRGFSGRADGPPTGRSNVGLVVRASGEGLRRDVEQTLYAAEPVSFALGEWLARGPGMLAFAFGEPGSRALWRALERLLEWSPDLRGAEVTVHAPCIEGVGDYPVDDGSLEVARGVWVAGDAGGRFRGIVASMVSGRYAAARIMAGDGR